MFNLLFDINTDTEANYCFLFKTLSFLHIFKEPAEEEINKEILKLKVPIHFDNNTAIKFDKETEKKQKPCFEKKLLT
jgi:hypothetical protein